MLRPRQSISVALLLAAPLCAMGQIGTGTLDIVVTSGGGYPQPATNVRVLGALSEVDTQTDQRGEAFVILPRGDYRVTAGGSREHLVAVRALVTTRIEIVTAGGSRLPEESLSIPSPHSLHGVL